MTPRRRTILVACIGVVVLAAVAAVLIAVIPRPSSLPPIESASYHQSKAVPGFDTSTHQVSGSARLGQLHDVLSKDGWSPGHNPPRQQGCTGGLSTSFTMRFDDGSTSSVSVYQCGTSNDALTNDLTALVASWS